MKFGLDKKMDRPFAIPLVERPLAIPGKTINFISMMKIENDWQQAKCLEN